MNVSTSTIDRWASSGKLKSYKSGKAKSSSVRFKKSEIDDAMKPQSNNNSSKEEICKA